MKSLTVAAIAAAAVLLPASAMSANLSVSATVLPFCSMTVPATLAFGSITPNGSAPATTSINISVLCSLGLDYSVSIDDGNSDGGTAGRSMSDGNSHTLDYRLTTDAAGTAVWGQAGDALSAQGLGLFSAANHAVYGRIDAADLDVPPGTYTDTVVVTLTY